MPEIFFEDIEPGAVTTFGAYPIARDDLVAFSRRFDAQPFHLDEAAAAKTPMGQLIASGWYNCAVQMRILCDGWLLRAASLGGLGIDELRWVRPVCVGDVLSVRQTILEKRVSASRPGAGIVRFGLELLNQREEVVMRTNQPVLCALREGPPPKMPLPPGPAAGEPAPRFAPEDPVTAPRDYEAVEIGKGTDLGCYDFTAERVIGFARRFDPQVFHLSEEEGRKGPFGALAASGWQTAAGWMRGLSYRLERLEAHGGRPRVAVSPGFRELKWLRPVYAGETIRYASEFVEKRPVASRPGWGLISSLNTGWNARGDCVLSFIGSAFWEMRDSQPGSLKPRG